MFCPTCGNNLPANAAFCSQCGSATLSANTPTPTQTYQTPPSNYQQPNYPPPSSQGIGYFDVLKKYCVFRGRARRKEFWMFTLVQSIINFVTSLLGNIFIAMGEGDQASLIIGAIIMALSTLFVFATLLPNLGVFVRRLHDTGRSGWWWICLVPFVGPIVLLVFLVQDSQPQANQYGPNPKI
ncbi:MAG: DUF805 domain-containing protein [Planctomycetaceae bacterium]|jgi:uncharacterized membrane protein YhaH (DUF805 family)|nr:DUF805 domain-containing protein [Planctomycetaceae bacterium]